MTFLFWPKKPSRFRWRLFSFLEIICFWAEKPFEFPILAEKSVSVSDKPCDSDSRTMKIRVKVACSCLTLSTPPHRLFQILATRLKEHVKVTYRNYLFYRKKIIRACLFCSRRDSTALLYSKFGVLKLEDMINMEIAKFMFKFYNKMLPKSFDSYFTKLDSIHSYNTRQKSTNEFCHYRAKTEMGKKKLHHICLKVWKNIPKKDRDVSFYRIKKLFKINCLSKYEKM